MRPFQLPPWARGHSHRLPHLLVNSEQGPDAKRTRYSPRQTLPLGKTGKQEETRTDSKCQNYGEIFPFQCSVGTSGLRPAQSRWWGTTHSRVPSPLLQWQCAWAEMLRGWRMSPTERRHTLIRIYPLETSAVISVVCIIWLSQEMVIFVWSLESQLKAGGAWEQGSVYQYTC